MVRTEVSADTNGDVTVSSLADPSMKVQNISSNGAGTDTGTQDSATLEPERQNPASGCERMYMNPNQNIVTTTDKLCARPLVK